VERPYIEYNIYYTRQAFALDKVEEQRYPVSPEFTAAMVDRNEHLLSQVRLWDPRALDAVGYTQLGNRWFQAARPFMAVFPPKAA
jgi:uncharacterized membrane protein (UPF0182 family)